MPVVGINIRTIEAKKNQQIIGNVRVNHTTNLKDVREEDIKALGKSGLAVAFEFKAEYVTEKSTKSLAEINIEGDVLYIDENLEKIIKEWKKEKKLNEDVNIQILNTILNECVIKSLNLSKDLQLPPTIPLPFASKKQTEEDRRYIG